MFLYDNAILNVQQIMMNNRITSVNFWNDR